MLRHDVGMAFQDDHFQAFCEVMECPQFMEDPAMNNMGARMADFDTWLDAIAEVIKTFTTEEALSRLEQAGVPFGPVKTIREFQQDPQVQHNGTIFDAEHPEAGTMRYVRYPGRLSDTPAALYKHPPRLGEHSAEILAGIGFSDADVQSLMEKGVIGNYEASLA